MSGLYPYSAELQSKNPADKAKQEFISNFTSYSGSAQPKNSGNRACQSTIAETNNNNLPRDWDYSSRVYGHGQLGGRPTPAQSAAEAAAIAANVRHENNGKQPRRPDNVRKLIDSYHTPRVVSVDASEFDRELEAAEIRLTAALQEFESAVAHRDRLLEWKAMVAEQTSIVEAQRCADQEKQILFDSALALELAASENKIAEDAAKYDWCLDDDKTAQSELEAAAFEARKDINYGW